MTKYLFLYWGPSQVNQDYQPSPEEFQEMFAQWRAWKEKFKEQVADLGDGLKHNGKFLTKAGEVTDGPLPEAKEIVTGYSIIQAKSMDEAVKVARACPIFMMPGATTEIRELMGY